MSRLQLGLRRRLQLAVIGGVALALAALIAAFNVVLRERLSHDADNALLARASAELASLQISAGGVSAPELPDAGAADTGTWVFAGTRALEQPPSDPLLEQAAELIGTGPRRTQDLASRHTRLYAVPVLAGGRRLGSVVAEVSLTPYESTANTALIASVLLGALVLVVVGVAARLAISSALRPVAYMSARAEAWSERDTGRRFGLGRPRDEITQLAATLDHLLDRVATSLRHEQRFSAELSHELRSPLSSIVAEAQLALRRPHSLGEHQSAYEGVLESAQQMKRTLETLVSAARVEGRRPRATGEAAAAIDAAVRASGPLAAERGIGVTVVVAEEPLRLGVDTDVAERVLAPLIENACRHGKRVVQIAAERSNGSVDFSVSDDGPGVPDDDRERIFEPGFSRDGEEGSGGAAGLGLPLARRLARAAEGDVVLAEGRPGACFVARLPCG
jgi:two-component system, OmpR family, sensor kinase